MIPTDSIGLALSVAGGMLKLGTRVDALLAEKAAVDSPLPLPQPAVLLGVTPEKMVAALQKLLKDPRPEDRAMIDADRGAIQALIDDENSSSLDLHRYYDRYFPDAGGQALLDFDAEFLTALGEARPGWNLEDPATRAAALYLQPGFDSRRKGYIWRISLSVVDVLAEFGAEHSALFLRNPQVQGVVGAVLKRFAEADVENADSWSVLLKAALRSTLDGALDQAAVLGRHERWLGAVLDAVVDARASAAEPDNFVLGLLQGDGYPRLVSSLLQAGARELSPEDEVAWKAVAAAVLQAGADAVEQDDAFEGFFRKHWSDLLRAGVAATGDHAAVLLRGKSPILQEVLGALTGTLATTDRSSLLQPETLYALADASIRVVAGHPELLGKLDRRRKWIGDFAGALVQVVASQGLQSTIDADGVQALLRKTLEFAGGHPELIVRHPGLVQTLIGGILGRVAASKAISGAAIADAAVSSALEALARNPFGLDPALATVVAGAAGTIAQLVKEQALDADEGRGLADVVVAALLANPDVLRLGKEALATLVVRATLKAAGGDERRQLAGAALVAAADRLLEVAARRGKTLAAKQGLEGLLVEVLQTGLGAAEAELGERLGTDDVPAFLAAFLDAWISGKIKSLSPKSKTFAPAVTMLIEAVLA